MNKKYAQIGALALISFVAIYGGYRLVKHLRRFKGDEVVSKGSKGNEVGAIQIALNNIIDDAKRGSNTDATKEARRKAVASLIPIQKDNIFDDKTEKVLLKIMGKNSASYNEVRIKRIQFSEAYGLGDPYKKQTINK